MKKKAPITLTQKAIERVAFLLDQRGKPSAGIRVGVKSGGCSGLSYLIEYADEIKKTDEIIECDRGVKVLIDSKALMYLINTQMDFVEEQFKSGFVFVNPNETARCGCGESFAV